MAARFKSSVLLLYISISLVSLSSAAPSRRRLFQSRTNPAPAPPQTQNIRVFFPSIPSPAFTNQPPPPSRPPAASPVSPPPQQVVQSKSDNGKVTKAVVATAFSSFAVSFLLFFAFSRYIGKKQRIQEVKPAPATALVSTPPPRKSIHTTGRVVSTNAFRAKAEGELKGVIVDENGLDVLYWRKLDELNGNRGAGDQRRYCDYCNGQLDRKDPDEEEQQRPRRRVQERPLLPAGSVNSSSGIVSDYRSSRNSSSSVSSLGPLNRLLSRQQPVARSPPPPAAHVPPPSPAAPMPFPLSSTSSKTIAPPPPPPLPSVAASVPTPPPPPPPPVARKAATPPPPPPPKAASSKPAAVPPPPASGRASESRLPPPPGIGVVGRTASADCGKALQPKLKPLHWDKVTPANVEHSMVWDKMSNGSFRFDDDLMEALFGYVATNRKSPTSSAAPTKAAVTASSSAATAGGPPAQVTLLDPRKSQNVAIVLRSLAVSRQEILDALLDGRGLGLDSLEKIARTAPSKEEEERILAYSGNPSRLADAESFLFHLLRAVPKPYARLDAMLFRTNYGPELQHAKESLATLELACREMRESGVFVKLLEAILKAGNRMNAGTARGNAQAFNLTALCKLSDVKSTDGSTTLLHFVVKEVVRSEGKRGAVNRNMSLRRTNSSISGGQQITINKEEREREYMKLGLPVVGGLSVALSNVKKAAAIDYDALLATCPTLESRVAEIRTFLEYCESGGFVKEMNRFCSAAEEELRALKEDQRRTAELVRRTTEYFQAGASKDKGAHSLQLFMIVREFLGMVDKVCVDLTRSLQKRRMPSSGSSSGDGSPSAAENRRRTPARFPNLPAHFMSEHSKSSSSTDSDDEEM